MGTDLPVSMDSIVLELALGKYVEAGIIAGLLVFNAALGLFQESRAQSIAFGPNFSRRLPASSLVKPLGGSFFAAAADLAD